MIAKVLLLVLSLESIDGGTPVLSVGMEPTRDAGTPHPFDAPLYAKCEPQDPKGVIQFESGAIALSAQQARRAACLLTTCDARRVTLEPDALEPQWAKVILGMTVAFITGLVVGAGLTVTWWLTHKV